MTRCCLLCLSGLIRVLVLVALAGAALSQGRTIGGVAEMFNLNDVPLRLSQSSWPGSPSRTMSLVNSVGATVIEYASLTMPFDAPGGIVRVLDNEVVVSGRDIASSNGFLCRVVVAGGANPSAVLVQSVAIAGFDPAALVYSPSDARLYMLDRVSSVIKSASWSESGGIGPVDMALSLAGLTFKPADLSLGIPGESQSGVFLRETSVSFAVGSAGPRKKAHVFLGGSPPSLQAVESVATPALLPPIRWEVEYPQFVGTNGPVRVRGAVGPFTIIDAVTGASVASGAGLGETDWAAVTLTSPLLPSHPYQVSGAASGPSLVFYPTYRAGVPTESSGYRMARGIFKPNSLRVGNPAFAVWCSMKYAGAAAPSSTVIPSYLWIKAGSPGSGTTLDLPGGIVLISSPDVILGPDPDDTPIDPVSNDTLMRFRIALPEAPEIAGVSLMFQFVTFNPLEEPNVSDVFGSVILDSPMMSAAATQAMQQSQEGQQSQQPLTFNQRVDACRNWLAGIGLSGEACACVFESVSRGLRSRSKR